MTPPASGAPDPGAPDPGAPDVAPGPHAPGLLDPRSRDPRSRDPGSPGRFELLGPLPTGTTVLEASAGTGKTFTVAALVSRYLAEGVVTMDQLLVVSFSRESTRELRQRVRERLVSARDGLAALDGLDHRDVGAAAAGDAVLAHLAAVPSPERRARRLRLEQALASFDAATVTTTHGFCQQVLTTLGTAGDSDPGAVLVEDLGDLVREVADDLHLRKWGRAGAEPAQMSRGEVRELALAVARDRATALVPGPDAPGRAGLRVRLAHAVRAELERRARGLHLVDHDDLLLRLDATLRDPVTGPAAVQRLRSRYRVVLVDEFQDTDPVQWRILREPFHGHAVLVLIGDPKQAIYSFRGADVHAYLDARMASSRVSTLPTSYRSDAALLRGLSAVLRGAALGDPRIRVTPVDAEHRGRLVRIGGPADGSGTGAADGAAGAAAGMGPGAPVRLRVVPRDGARLTGKGLLAVGDAREAVVADLAAQVVSLLSGAAELVPRAAGGGSPGGSQEAVRAVAPGDVAVLVRTNKEAQLVGDRLRAAGVPVVLTGRTSVFSTEAAAEWQLLLEALEQPHRTTRVRRLALGRLVGLTTTELAEPGRGDAATEDLALRLRGWGRVLDQRGVAALFEAVSLSGPLVGSAPGGSPALAERLLGREGGERLLTDLRHVAQALHEAALEGRLGLTALVAWLRRRREDGARDGSLERSRRLESDAAAVQVVTVHTSKGLEFPVVMVPFAWSRWGGPDITTAVAHEDGRRVRDVGGPGGPRWREHQDQHARDEADDELRLTYVALTRAQGHLVLWWAPSTLTPTAPLHRLLLHGDATSGPAAAPQTDPTSSPAEVARTAVPVPSDTAALARFRALAAGSDGGLAVEVVRPRDPAPWRPPEVTPPPLAVARFDRDLDTAWRRTSYSALTAAAHDAPRVGSEPEGVREDDEAAGRDLPGGGQEQAPGDADAALRDLPSAWDALAGGTRFGTLVHAVLEELEDAADARAVTDLVAAQVGRHSPGTDPAGLTTGLAAGVLQALATPLGEQAGELALRDVAAADRLPELDFELPLAGGDEPASGRAVLADLAPLWRAHCPDGPLAGYADALAELDPDAEVALRGYLTGSIDAVLRVRDAAAPGSPVRYLVVDYKTNRLGVPGEPLTTWDYRPQALVRAMVEAHYPLQALLYEVALHRYLRWRQPGYDPGTHLGGALYLFLRGMPGPGVRCADGSVPGVAGWRPPAGLVTATSDLLAGLSSPVPGGRR